MNKPCHIIGVLQDGTTGLTAQALRTIQQADMIIGGTRTLSLMSEHFSAAAEQFDLTGQLSTVPEKIRQTHAQDKSAVVLATGDPLCHGIATYLIKQLGQDNCIVIPNLSTVQLICARFGFSWQDSKICSVHNKDAGEWSPGQDMRHGLYSLLQSIVAHDRLVVFTSPENDPSRIARMLQQEEMTEGWFMYVAENLTSAEERLHHRLSIDTAAAMQFTSPNILILTREDERPARPLFGSADENFQQRKPDKGLITKREVRAVALARLQLCSRSIVWDIGAGSGAVGLEAARLCPQGHVYAIEKNAADVRIALNNKKLFGCTNYTLVQGKAPALLDDWPKPDAIFIGGSGGELQTLIEYCLQGLQPGGWLVMNFVTLENLSLAIETLKRKRICWDVTQLNAARSQPILHMQRMAAENPVWIVCARAGSKQGE